MKNARVLISSGAFQNKWHLFFLPAYSSFCEYFLRKEVRTMNINPIIKTNKNETTTNGTGFKIIEINVADPAQGLFSVVTPIKMK
jgi:hypothetical protein